MDNRHYTIIGMDVSDRKTQVCVMAREGGRTNIVTETAIPTTKDGLKVYLASMRGLFDRIWMIMV